MGEVTDELRRLPKYIKQDLQRLLGYRPDDPTNIRKYGLGELTPSPRQSINPANLVETSKKIFKDTLVVEGVGTFQIASRSRHDSDLGGPDKTPRGTTMISTGIDQDPRHSGDFGLVRKVGKKSVIALITDPVSSLRTSAKNARRFIAESYDAIRLHEGTAREAAETILAVASDLNYRIGQEGINSGNLTFAILGIDPECPFLWSLGDSGNLYLQRLGFYINRDNANMLDFGTNEDGKFCPEQINGDTNALNRLVKFEIADRYIRGRQLVLATDYLTKLVRTAEFTLPEWRVYPEIERCFTANNPAKDLVQKAPQIDDAVAVCAKLD